MSILAWRSLATFWMDEQENPAVVQAIVVLVILGKMDFFNS
jgi:hypothetical protein